MTHPSLKTTITVLFPLAISLLVALLLLASQNNYWNITSRFPAQQAPALPAHQQSFLYTTTISAFFLLFLIMRFLLVRITKPFFEEKDERHGISPNPADTPYSEECGQIHQARNFTAIKEDISAIVENQLQHAQKLEASRQLSSGIAHDFNNILTAIIGYGNILLTKLPAESSLRTTIEQILAAAERGAGLTQKLQTFSREQISNFKLVDLNATIERVEMLLHSLIGTNIKLVSLLAKQRLMVMVANRQVEQALIILVTNARDTMPEGGTITLKSELVDLDDHYCASHGIDQKGHHALLAISYPCPGMDGDTTHEILAPSSTTGEAAKEARDGLSIIDGIIKKHNGHIICSTGPNDSTNVCIYLPIREDESETLLPLTPVTLPNNPASHTVLLVDSKEAGSSITKDFLEEFGYCVIEAADADMALEKYRTHRTEIHLAIIDGIITGTHGIEIFHEIKTVIPINRIILCGDPENNAIKQLHLYNSNLHFIAKPFSPKELLMNIKEVLKDAI